MRLNYPPKDLLQAFYLDLWVIVCCVRWAKETYKLSAFCLIL